MVEKSAKVIEETKSAVYRFDTLVAAFLKDDAKATDTYNIERTVSRTKGAPDGSERVRSRSGPSRSAHYSCSCRTR